MFRLICKSRTRKIRRMIFSVMTAFAILVQALSASFESNAARPSYHGGDVIAVVLNATGNPLVSVMRSDGGYSPISTYATLKNSVLPTSRNSFTIDTLSFHLSSVIPVNSDIYVYFGIKIWVQNGGSNSTSVSYRDCSFSFSNPLSTYMGGSVNVYDSPDEYSREVFFSLHCQNPGYSISSILLESLKIYYDATFFNSGYEGVGYVYLMDCRVISYPIDTNPNASVLEDIRDNTGATTDAINDQTQQVTEGYDNSQTTNDNQQLADAMQDYDNSQSAAVGDSTGYIDDVSFFDPSSSSQVMSGITLTGSFLQSLFENLGQWGAVVMVSLSLTFGLMLVGWFKFRK